MSNNIGPGVVRSVVCGGDRCIDPDLSDHLISGNVFLAGGTIYVGENDSVHIHGMLVSSLDSDRLLTTWRGFLRFQRGVWGRRLAKALVR